ncbi:polymeric immunoglobulin receptor-like isoform 2-T2 [Clarias gariepinus]
MLTLKNVSVKHGESVTIPCLYEERYKTNAKFWCSGYFWSTCSIEAYANSHGSTSVTDYPAHNMFTVEINSVSDYGWYWCAIEIGGIWDPDDRNYLYLTVSKDPDLSVVKSSVKGEEGGSVTVQCLYSAAYRNTQKYWCRFKDRSCETVGMASQDLEVDISDNGSSFSVEIRGLKKSDAGWYWCGAGDLQVPVHIRVGDEAPGLSALTTESM